MSLVGCSAKPWHGTDLNTRPAPGSCRLPAPSCPELRNLGLNWIKPVLSSERLAAVASNCPMLESLSLDLDCFELGRTGQAGPGAAALPDVLGSLRALRTLRLWGSSHLSNQSLRELAERLDTRNRPPAKEGTLPATSSPRLPSLLASLDLSECTRVGNEGVEAIVAVAPNLTALRLAGMAGLDDRGLAAIAKLCPLLETLDVAESAVSDAGLRLLRDGCKGLTTLDVSGCDVTEVSIATLSPALRSIRLSVPEEAMSHEFGGNVADGFAAACAGRFPLLESFNLLNAETLTGAGLAELGRCKELKSLSLGSFISLEEEPEAFDQVCEAWAALETVTFTDTEVPDACLGMLATRCTAASTPFWTISHALVIAMTHCTRLVACPTTCTCRWGADSCLASDGVPDTGLSGPRLAAVDLSCCTGFTADGIASLGRCRRLGSLRLWGCDVVTDDWLEVLGSYDRLADLNVDGCSQLSAAAVQAFRARYHLGAQTVKSVPDLAADSAPRMWDPDGFSCMGRCS